MGRVPTTAGLSGRGAFVIATGDVGGSYRLPFRRLFWVPIGMSAALVLLALAGLAVVAWRGMEGIRPLQTHLHRIARIQDMALSMEQTLLEGLRGAHIDPTDIDRLRLDVTRLAAMDGHMHPETPARLAQVAEGLDMARLHPVDGLVESMAAVRQVLAGEREYHRQLLDKVAGDTALELRLAVALLGIVPLAGGGLLLVLRARIKHPLDDLGNLLGRLAARDYRPVAQTALTESTALVQPVLHSYNELVCRLQDLEADHRGREQTLQREVRKATDLAEAERLLAVRHLEPLVVVSDMSLPDGNAMDLLERIRPMGSAGEWIFLTAYGGVPESVRALKIGAFDFLEKPCDTERLQLVVTGAARSARAQRRLSEEARVRSSRFTPTAYVGRSRPAQQVRDMLGRLARVPCTALLITGETGTGKGLAARILHHAGPRRGAPFVEINCATLPRELMEAELFGHEAGAFPGAEGPHRGLLEQANGGTLFLGEIGELQLGVQAKLLTAIEDRRVRRLGTDRELEIDLQVIAATIQELEVRVAKGTFHADLYHRLAVCRLAMPPLRSRKEDLEDLLPLFIGELNACCGRRVVTIPPAVWRRLAAYDWPGNVRELRNLVERCVLLANGPVFPERWLHLGEEPGAGDAAPSVSDHSNGLYLPLDGSVSLDQMERRILCEALARNGDDVNLTARLLGTTQDKLRYGVQKYGLRTSD